MKYGLLILTIFLCFSTFGKAQEKDSIRPETNKKFNNQAKIIFKALAMPRIGYTYNNGSFLQIGAKYPLFLNEKFNSLMVGGKAQLGYMNDSFIIIPEIDAFYAFQIAESDSKRVAIGLGANLSPYYVAPKMMFEVWIFPQIELSYNFEYKTHENFNSEGIKLSIGFDLF